MYDHAHHSFTAYYPLYAIRMSFWRIYGIDGKCKVNPFESDYQLQSFTEYCMFSEI